MIVIKEPHALKVSFVTVMLKARHHCVSWGNCVAVFVCVPGLFCFHQWVSLSLLVVVLGVYFCWSLTLCPRHTHTQMHTHMGTYTVHTHRYTHTHMGTYTVHTHTGTHAHTHGHIHSAHTHRYTHIWAHTQHTHRYTHMGTYTAHTHRCTRTHTWAHTQCTNTQVHMLTHMGTYTVHTHTGAHAHTHGHTHRCTLRHGYTQFPPSLPSLMFPPHILSLSPPFLLFTLPFLLLQMSTFNVLLDPPLLNLRKSFFWTLRNIYSRNHTRNNQGKKSANNEKGQHW